MVSLHCRSERARLSALRGPIEEALCSNESRLRASHLLVPLLEMFSPSLFESVSSDFMCRFLREPSRTAPGPLPCPPSPHARPWHCLSGNEVIIHIVSQCLLHWNLSVMRLGTTSVLFSTETQGLLQLQHLARRRCLLQDFE